MRKGQTHSIVNNRTCQTNLIESEKTSQNIEVSADSAMAKRPEIIQNKIG